MNAVLDNQHKTIAGISDLNSVLLEGEVAQLYPPLESVEACTHIELRSQRYNRNDARKNTTNFIRVDITCIDPSRRNEFFIGRKVRVVGRLNAPHRKPASLVAEHVEFRPIPQSSLVDA